MVAVRQTRDRWRRIGRTDVLERGAVVAALVAFGVVARLITRSPLWLDEALSLNIASVPLDELAAALRRDGHPPLYYAVLGRWTAIFGGDSGARLLSGIAAVAVLPLAHRAGVRLGGTRVGSATLVLFAITPWWFRYGTEARMYAVVALGVLVGWFLVHDLLARRSRPRQVALAALTGGMVLTHYWVWFLLAAVAIVLVAAARADRTAVPGVGRVLVAVGAGACAFVPWLPAFVHQVQHTGTPWGTATRPTRALVELAAGLGGAERYAESLLFGFGVLGLALLGLLAIPGEDGAITVTTRPVPVVRAEVAVAALTVVLGLAAGAVTNAPFVARYAAVVVPLVLLAGGVGLARLPRGPGATVVLGAMVAFALVAAATNVRDDRSQGREIAAAISAEVSPDDVVVFCPDQLGPSTLRYLPRDIPAVGLPRLGRPDRIDWTDYAERNRAAVPQAAVDAVAAQARSGTIWLVIRGGYRTYEGYCEAVQALLAQRRPAARTVVADRGADVFEGASLLAFPPA